ncbi:recombination-associated protein RdgC [Pseudoalteromonas obscura]|uniref:Recombination-associated protein RdgC n=1 Tax=Pseudoalteromonas obscura TaxID=3048491 RepID=A0ABT7EHA7_9GAMM|nr:recombination-associated protein RdgC [Pseudoalteromonas sp. P94(2023)]MDK2594427.1 recombination-associated protein RdgC [Pseudoalteromonas sp. P94(2023)]
MYLSNVQVYKFKSDVIYHFDDFEESLQQDKARNCGAQELSTFGWTNALGDHGNTLAYFSQGKILLCAKRFERVIPASVLNDMVHEQVKKVELEENRSVKKKEREQIKDDILTTITPQAFEKAATHYVLIDTISKLIFVESANHTKAEETLALLRKSLGTLPVAPAFADLFIDTALTEYVSEQVPPKNFDFGGLATLVDSAEKTSEITLKDRDLYGDEIPELMTSMLVSKLEMKYKDRLTFTIHSDGSIKRIKYSDVIKETNNDIASEEIAHRLGADFILVVAELTELFNSIYQAIREKIDQGYEDCTQKSDIATPNIDAAEKIIIETKNTSISNLQRSLRIGYSNASHLLTELEKKGVVSAPGNNGLRELLA